MSSTPTTTKIAAAAKAARFAQNVAATDWARLAQRVDWLRVVQRGAVFLRELRGDGQVIEDSQRELVRARRVRETVERFAHGLGDERQ